MTTDNTCKKCGCQDQALTTPIVYPTPAPCPDPQPCSEAFDSQCVYFTKGDILCGTDIVVYQDDTVEDALIQIVDYFCNYIPPTPIKGVLPVNIFPTIDPTILASSIVGGTAPFTYNWSFAQNILKGHTFATSTALSTMTFDLTTDGIRTIAGEALYQSLVKLEVTDADGSYGSAYYSFSSLVVA